MRGPVLMRKIGIAASLMALFLGSSATCADEWPHRAVRVVVPFAAGSGPDFAARLYAERLGERWKQPVVIDDRRICPSSPETTMKTRMSCPLAGFTTLPRQRLW